MRLKYKLTIIFMCLGLLLKANPKDSVFDFGLEMYAQVRVVDFGITEDTAVIVLNLREHKYDLEYLVIDNMSLDFVSLQDLETNEVQIAGQNIYPNNLNEAKPTFKLSTSKKYIIKLLGDEQLLVPISIRSSKEKDRVDRSNTLVQGFFVGVLTSLILYNLFLLLFLRDETYFYYILFLITIGFAQFHLLGINYYLFGSLNTFYPISFQFFSALAGIAGLLFTEKFLQLTKRLKWSRLFLIGIITVYSLVPILLIAGYCHFAFRLLQFGAVSFLYILFASYTLAFRGQTSALYFSFAWTIFIAGLFLFVLKDFEVVPINLFTQYTMTFGVGVAAVVLSLALADRINVLNKEKQEANDSLITETKKNEQLIQNQNVTLEKKVKERTAELQLALDNLKAAQSKLVQSEKMASLGVLTAGIAHEINNPINFVTANIIPLRENMAALTQLIAAYKSCDINDLEAEIERLRKVEKDLELDYILTEIPQLIDGIEEGAKRTHTIVDGLKTFSRGDAGNKAKADINAGIKSTVSVLKSRLNQVKVELNLQKGLPKVNCQMGKINQVLLNLINNAVDALEEKNGPNSSSSKVSISSVVEDSNLLIIISDNGDGMSTATQEKIMEPFYTTKPVGKGTGLGLSISYSIIKEHDGSISLVSEEGIGTTFTVSLPVE